MLFFGAIAVIALCARSEAFNFEDVGYAVGRNVFMANGYSETRADCIMKVLKITGVTDDLTDIRNLFNPENTTKKLSDKFQVAEFVCSPPGIAVIALIFCFVIAFLCVCLKRCCCSNKPIVVQMGTPQFHAFNKNVPYARMDIA